MNTSTTDALLLRSDDGSLYAIPRDLLARCKVHNNEAPEVQGYLHAQATPPGFAAHYDVLGFSAVSITGGLRSWQEFGIIIVGGRTQ